MRQSILPQVIGAIGTVDRRKALIGAGAMVVGADSAFATPVAKVPKGATDSHVHVFDPVRFPYSEARDYTPGVATLQDLESFRARLGTSRLVLVQPSVYGTDNRCLIDALRRLTPQVARAIAAIDPTTITDDELHALQRLGVVGVRVNLNVKGKGESATAVKALSQTLSRVTPFGLITQIYVDLSLLDALSETIGLASVPVLLDHFGGAHAQLGPDQPGCATLRRLLGSGNVWVKLSAPYRVSHQDPDYPDMTPIARTLIAENVDRLVWGSDWPHTGGGAQRAGRQPTDVEPFRVVDDAHILALLASWAADKDICRRILVDNAQRLYGF
jgi:predicted TIM-barrel fold metal-dependent hydrolase